MCTSHWDTAGSPHYRLYKGDLSAPLKHTEKTPHAQGKGEGDSGGGGGVWKEGGGGNNNYDKWSWCRPEEVNIPTCLTWPANVFKYFTCTTFFQCLFWEAFSLSNFGWDNQSKSTKELPWWSHPFSFSFAEKTAVILMFFLIFSKHPCKCRLHCL